MKTSNWLIVIAGIWLILSPFILGFSGTTLSLNDVVTGIIIAIIALLAVGMPAESRWLDWVNVILGAWIFITPFVMTAVGASMWNNAILGIITVVLGVWGATSMSSTSSSQHPTTA